MSYVDFMNVLGDLLQVVITFWNWLDSVQVGGVSLLTLFIAIACFDVLMFVAFGFQGWGGDKE